MSNIIEMVNHQVSAVEHVEKLDLELGSSKVGYWVIMSMTAIVGIWGSVCFVSGLGSCANVAEIGKSLMTALTGL